ncbi:hypothetical protein [Spirillospora sp. CA-294931]|uniref:hypothetical protein n=1 Tax=Spirillospora sp. CA-294931 TaxID=3240042 RepID=UPI003D8F0097
MTIPPYEQSGPASKKGRHRTASVVVVTAALLGATASSMGTAQAVTAPDKSKVWQAPVKPQAPLKVANKKFRTCVNARMWWDSGKRASNTNIAVGYQFDGAELEPKERPDGSVYWKASADMNSKVYPKRSTMTITNPTWPRMTVKQKVATKQFRDGLIDYENTRIKMIDALLERHGQLQALGFGKSQGQALQALARDKGVVQGIAMGMVRHSLAYYDRHAKYGRMRTKLREAPHAWFRQWAGKNVTLTCPR